jgi:lysophospholipase L1-like esterase
VAAPAPPARTATATRLGVLALGDSITNGHGGMQVGLGSQSWAHWLAQALNLPFTKHARDGAHVPNVLCEQIPAVRGHYDLGCVYIGVNDVRAPTWDEGAYEQGLREILGFLRGRADRALTVTIPLDLGVPPAGPKVAGANAIVRRVAGEAAAAVVDLSDFSGRRHVWADRVHATAVGQVAIADRAALALRRAGMEVPVLPSSLVALPEGRRAWLHYDARFAMRAVREHGGGLVRGWQARRRGYPRP